MTSHPHFKDNMLGRTSEVQSSCDGKVESIRRGPWTAGASFDSEKLYWNPRVKYDSNPMSSVDIDYSAREVHGARVEKLTHGCKHTGASCMMPATDVEGCTEQAPMKADIKNYHQQTSDVHKQGDEVAGEYTICCRSLPWYSVVARLGTLGWFFA